MARTRRGLQIVFDLWNADVPCLAIENPVMQKYAKERIRNYQDFSQSVQPWEFATDHDGEDNVKKRTCFWTRNLPNLVKTGTLDGSTARADVHNAAPSADRWKIRSKFYPALAAAMADQWGRYASINRKAVAMAWIGAYTTKDKNENMEDHWQLIWTQMHSISSHT